MFDAALTQARCIFMDCDGVIFDVNQQKTDAFRMTLEAEPAARVDELICYHQRHGGISRYRKFDHFFRELSPHADPERAAAQACVRFGELVRASYRSLQPHPAALAFAARAGAVPVYVISGSDELELQQVFRDHEIVHHFAGIHGSPVGKAEHMRRILAERDLPPHEAIMIGDGRGDLDACKTVGLRFVFLAEMTEWSDVESAWQEEHFLWAATWQGLTQGMYRDVI